MGSWVCGNRVDPNQGAGLTNSAASGWEVIRSSLTVGRISEPERHSPHDRVAGSQPAFHHEVPVPADLQTPSQQCVLGRHRILDDHESKGLVGSAAHQELRDILMHRSCPDPEVELLRKLPAQADPGGKDQGLRLGVGE